MFFGVEVNASQSYTPTETFPAKASENRPSKKDISSSKHQFSEVLLLLSVGVSDFLLFSRELPSFHGWLMVGDCSPKRFSLTE